MNCCAANSPNTGREIFIISDEPYRRIIYDGLTYSQVFPHYQNTVVVTSHAKDLALPGERIGYIAIHPEYPDREELANGATFCNRTLGFVNAPALMQHLVRSLQGVSVDVADYQRKRDYLYTQLTELGYSVTKPQGAFYLFPKSPLDDDVAFVDALQEWNVLAVPGRGFGTPGYFRISYCVEDPVLEGAMNGFDPGGGEVGTVAFSRGHPVLTPSESRSIRQRGSIVRIQLSAPSIVGGASVWELSNRRPLPKRR